MGKRSKPPGLPKREGNKRQQQEIHARAMLLGAVWDKHTSMFIKNEAGEHGGHLTTWTTYFDVNGHEIPIKYANKRIAEAEKRYKLSRHGYTTSIIPKPRNSDKSSYAAMLRQRNLYKGAVEKSTGVTATINEYDHAADALKYAVDCEIMDKMAKDYLGGNSERSKP